jgi:hypothetical protein
MEGHNEGTQNNKHIFISYGIIILKPLIGA